MRILLRLQELITLISSGKFGIYLWEMMKWGYWILSRLALQDNMDHSFFFVLFFLPQIFDLPDILHFMSCGSIFG